jgi:hypothetical protein
MGKDREGQLTVDDGQRAIGKSRTHLQNRVKIFVCYKKNVPQKQNILFQGSCLN